MATATQVEIKIDGKKVEDFNNLQLQQNLFGHHSLEIVCRRDLFEKEGNFILDKSDGFLGAKITLKITSTKNNKNEFSGIVTGIRANKTFDNLDTVVIIAQSPDILLDDGEHCRSFEDKTPEKIIKEIVKEYNLGTDKIKPKKSTDSLPYTVQYKESAYAFINRMAAKKGEWFFYDGTDLVFGKLPAKTVELNYGQDLFHFDFSMSVDDLKFKYIGYDYVKEKIIKSASGSQNVPKISDQTTKAISSSNKLYKKETQSLYNHSLSESNPTNQLDNRVQLEKSGLASGLVNLSGSSDNPGVSLGCVIHIKESVTQENNVVKKVDHGKYIITSLSHSCDRSGNYQNDFTAVPDKVEVPPYSTPHAIPFCETQSAKVMENNNDPDELGRIKVQFFWQQQDNTTSPWLRVLTPHSGLDQGFFFIPEIDDEVLVGFEGGNAEKPYVIGSLYNGTAKPKTLSGQDNNIKAIRTRSGHTIEFIDEDGKEELKIYDYKKENYVITLASHSKEIKIESTGDISIESKGNFSVKADGDMDLEAKGKLNIKANGAVLDSKADIELKGTNMKIDAKANYEAKGAMVKIEAKATMDLKSSAKMSVDGGGMLEQKGGIIMIN